jgi:hypothetical protein
LVIFKETKTTSADTRLYTRLVGNLQNTLDTTILNLTREHT